MNSIGLMPIEATDLFNSADRSLCNGRAEPVCRTVSDAVDYACFSFSGLGIE
jgi:hypothetical protein